MEKNTDIIWDGWSIDVDPSRVYMKDKQSFLKEISPILGDEKRATALWDHLQNLKKEEKKNG